MRATDRSVCAARGARREHGELTEDAKLHSSGHYRINEAESLTGLLDVAAKKPAIFEALADKDAGADPSRWGCVELLAPQRVPAKPALGPGYSAIR